MRRHLSTWYQMMAGTMPPPGGHASPVQMQAIRALNGMVYGAVLLIIAGVALVAAWSVTGTVALQVTGYWLIGVSWAELIILGAATASARLRERRRSA